MILPDFILPGRANQCWQYSGLDSPEKCWNKTHFKNYPWDISYCYNSRGFRDQEWPTDIDDLQNAIWCVGDSFTVGIGSPANHTWPYLLNQQTGTRTINVSLDGASNNWIARKAKVILEVIKPKKLIIHWSFLHRREDSIDNVKNMFWQEFYNNIKDSSWPNNIHVNDFDTLPTQIQYEINNKHDASWKTVSDENLRLFEVGSTDQEDILNLVDCINIVNSCDTEVIHSIIPEFTRSEYQQLANKAIQDTTKFFIPEFNKLDTARDGLHYDIKTASYFVDKIIKLL